MLWLKILAGMIGFAGFLLLSDRLLLKMESRGWIFYRKNKPNQGSLTNAILSVQSIIEPAKKYELEVRQEERLEQAGEAAPPAPGGEYNWEGKTALHKK
jgi:hypothetical protein